MFPIPSRDRRRPWRQSAPRLAAAPTRSGRRAGEIGCTVVGRRAESVLADLDDPSYVPLDSAARQLVHPEGGPAGRTVIVDGRPVIRDGALATMDEAAVATAA